MAEDTKKRRKRIKGTSGRATPKAPPSRYTPPVPMAYKQSSRWVPIFMFTFFALGVLLIIINYLPGALFLPGGSSPYYLLGGLGLICLGFMVATRLH